MRSEPAAIGYLRKDISGTSLDWDQAQIRRMAQRLGYELPKTVMFSAVTDNPVERLLNVVRHLDVEAVIVPSSAHFDDALPDTLLRVCDLITVAPEQTHARWAPMIFANSPTTATTLRDPIDNQLIYLRANEA